MANRVMTMQELEISRREWVAWRLICRLLQDQGIDVNQPEHENLVRVIRHWGEMYQQVHAQRDAATAARLLDEKGIG